MPDDAVVRRLIDSAHGVALLSIVKVLALAPAGHHPTLGLCVTSPGHRAHHLPPAQGGLAPQPLSAPPQLSLSTSPAL